MSAMALTLDTLVSQSPDEVSCDVGGEAVILNLKTGVYYGLDPVGARIWKLLSGGSSVAQVRDAVLAEYDVTAETCERDLLDLIEKLVAEGLVSTHATQSP